MVWLRMVQVAVRLAWPYLLIPWRSPLLRWRMETYGLLDARGQLVHADDITPSHFLQFACRNYLALGRFFRWAACL